MLRTDGVVPSGVGMTAAAGLGRGERAPDMVLASRDGAPTRYHAHAGGGPGAPAPDMVLASRDGTPTRYYAHAGGRPALLVFADEGCVGRLEALAEGLAGSGGAERAAHRRGRPRAARARAAS